MARKAKKRLPDLPETGRIYVDRTRGGWLMSPGVERHAVARRRRPLLAIAVAILAALALLIAWSAWGSPRG